MANDTLIAIGEALIDFIPNKKGCEFYEVGAFSPKIGGAPTNVCGAFARLGGKARLITQLGNDPFGMKIIRELNGYGIDTSSISFTDKANTALAFVSLDKTGNRTFQFYRKPSADILLSPKQLDDDSFKDAFALHFCSVSLGDFPMKYAHIAAIKKAESSGALISFDPNLRRRLWDSDALLKQAVKDFMPSAHIIKISDEELEFITGENKIKNTLPLLFKGRTELVVYTTRIGASVFTKKHSVYSSAPKAKAIDTTGAGDGFIGSFLWKLMKMNVTPENLPSLDEAAMKECADFSNKFCSISVQKMGAISSYPNLNEVMSLKI